MSDVQITVTIPEELAKNAQEFGLLTPEHLIALLEADVEQKTSAFVAEGIDEARSEQRETERDLAIQKARAMLTKLDALEPRLTEAEIDQEIREAHTNS